MYERPLTRSLVSLLALGISATTTIIRADDIVLVTSAAAQNAGDTVSWSQLGADNTILPQLISVSSRSGIALSIAFAGPDSVTSVACTATPCSWTGVGFRSGETILWTSDAGNGSNGPITANFGSGVAGAGALLQANTPGQFTVEVDAYNGDLWLGTVSATSNAAGDAMYIGVGDQTGSNITSLVIGLIGCAGDCGDFGIGTIYLTSVATPAPVVNLTAESVTFAGQLIGTASGAQNVTVSNTGTAALTITNITATGDFSFTTDCGQVAQGTSCSVDAVFTPSAAGLRTGTIAITDNALSSPQIISLSGTGTTGAGLLFVPIAPCRVADTRNPDGPFGGPMLTAYTTRDFAIPSSSCGIPAAAQAYSLNVAVVPSSRLGYLTAWPAGQLQPNVATLNSWDGRIKSNAAIIPAGAGGAITVFVNGTTQLIIDINGYFVPASDTPALAFYPLSPCRVVDTRFGEGPLAGPRLPGGTVRDFPVLSSSCGIPQIAMAYSLNFAVVPKGSRVGYLTAWPSGLSQPNVATLNATTGTVVANAAIVGAGVGGDISIYTRGDTDIVIDVNGYFAPPGSGGLSLYNLTPCRVLDTRYPPYGTTFEGQLDVDVAGSICGVGQAAGAYVFNATVVPAGQFYFLTLWPNGQSLPTAANVNAFDAAVTSNLAIVPTTNGLISAWASDPTHLILDAFGYFAP